METVTEEWRAVPEHDGYEVSDLGRVRSLSRTIHYTRNGKHLRKLWNGRVLVAVPHKGYLTVKLGKHWRVFGVHQLVAMVFHGPCPAGFVIDHVDTNKHNNRPGNLEYVTNGENVRRAHRNNLMRQPRGEQHGMCRLSDQQVDEIRCNIELKSLAELAMDYGVSRQWIRLLQSGKRRV